MSQMKFLNDAETAVEDALRGFKCSYPALFVDPRNRIVLRNQVCGKIRRVLQKVLMSNLNLCF